MRNSFILVVFYNWSIQDAVSVFLCDIELWQCFYLVLSSSVLTNRLVDLFYLGSCNACLWANLLLLMKFIVDCIYLERCGACVLVI